MIKSQENILIGVKFSSMFSSGQGLVLLTFFQLRCLQGHSSGFSHVFHSNSCGVTSPQHPQWLFGVQLVYRLFDPDTPLHFVCCSIKPGYGQSLVWICSDPHTVWWRSKLSLQVSHWSFYSTFMAFSGHFSLFPIPSVLGHQAVVLSCSLCTEPNQLFDKCRGHIWCLAIQVCVEDTRYVPKYVYSYPQRRVPQAFLMVLAFSMSSERKAFYCRD